MVALVERRGDGDEQGERRHQHTSGIAEGERTTRDMSSPSSVSPPPPLCCDDDVPLLDVARFDAMDVEEDIHAPTVVVDLVDGEEDVLVIEPCFKKQKKGDGVVEVVEVGQMREDVDYEEEARRLKRERKRENRRLKRAALAAKTTSSSVVRCMCAIADLRAPVVLMGFVACTCFVFVVCRMERRDRM